MYAYRDALCMQFIKLLDIASQRIFSICSPDSFISFVSFSCPSILGSLIYLHWRLADIWNITFLFLCFLQKLQSLLFWYVVVLYVGCLEE